MTDLEAVQCSAKGCRATALHVLVWNNPKVHTPDREKTWVACDGHRSSLAEHLDVRGFLRRVEPLAAQASAEGPGNSAELSAAAAPELAAAGRDRVACATCGASFPSGQDVCPACAGLRTGSCGGRI